VVDVQVDVDAEQVWLEVKDNGRGIPEDRLRAVESGSGKGVGLAGMRERVRELGGSLTIESSQAGTLLRISIPIAENIEKPSTREHNSPRGPSAD
jgi:signal transduction histidine kinase